MQITSATLRSALLLTILQFSTARAVVDAQFSDANWGSLNTDLSGIPGTDRKVLAAVADTSGNLYTGGEFIVAGNVVANRIAKWNGTNWSALGSGMNGTVRALAVSGSDLYAAGDFTTAGGVSANRIARWNGTSWSAFASGMNGTVQALAVSDGNLFAGGRFTTAGGVSANYIAKWDGSSWSALASGLGGEYPEYTGVQALAVTGSDLYAGGDFTMAGGVSATNIAKWNGSSWSALGLGMGGAGDYYSDVQALAVSGTDVYAGGRFETAGGNRVNYIAKWDGNNWSALGSGTAAINVSPPDVTALAVLGGDLYAGGYFETVDGVATGFTAKWNGTTWSALGSGLGQPSWAGGANLFALAVSGTDLYAGGDFTRPDGLANNIAKWNGSSWSALGSGMDGGVSALAASSGALYAGGHFTMVGGVEANSIAKWNGSHWTAMGSGLGGSDYRWVGALVASGINVYAGGQFTTAGGVSATNIAKWNGSSWSTLGSGLGGGDGVNPPSVQALAVSGSDLYAGGSFTTAGGVPAINIAKWNGSSWSALGSGMNFRVDALAVSGSDLYAGGWFTTAGGVSATNIAKWNGTSWSALGSGMNGFVQALAVSGSDLYAGGSFTTAGGVSANHIAKWDGSRWSALGAGLGGVDYPPVSELVISGTDLYAGGSFTTAGGMSANYIAKWNGSHWSALGSGMGGASFPYVTALALVGSDLYAGGSFSPAGRKVSPYVARAYLEQLPTLTLLRTGGSMTLSWPSSFGEFVLQQNSDVTNANEWSNSPYSIITNGPIRSATAPISSGKHFFRLKSK